jgi:excinuclease UvrABC ATPase subunit
VTAPCPDCKGTSVAFTRLPDAAGRYHQHESECPRCDGTGRVNPIEDAVLAERLRAAAVRAAQAFKPREARS